MEDPDSTLYHDLLLYSSNELDKEKVPQIEEFLKSDKNALDYAQFLDAQSSLLKEDSIQNETELPSFTKAALNDAEKVISISGFLRKNAAIITAAAIVMILAALNFPKESKGTNTTSLVAFSFSDSERINRFRKLSKSTRLLGQSGSVWNSYANN